MALPFPIAPPRSLLPGEEDPNAMPGAAPLTTSVGEGGGGDTAAVLAAALTPPATVDTTHTTGPQRTTHEVLPSPAAVEGMASLDVAAAKRAEAESKLAAEAVHRAEIEAKVEEGKQLAAQYAAGERMRKKQEDQAVVDAAVARDMTKRQLMERASDNLGKSYWADKSAPYRILSALVSGIGDYAHIKSGGQGLSPASQALEEEIAKDRQQKVAIFQNSEKFQKLAAEDVVKAKELMAEHLKDIDIMQSAMVNKLTGAMSVYAARSKIPEAQAEAQKASAIAAGKDAELKAKLGEHYAMSVTRAGSREDTTHTDNVGKTTGGNKPSEGEASLALASKSMLRDLEILQKNPLKPGTLEAVQNAALSKAAAEEAGAKGNLAATMVNFGRGIGWVPRSVVESLPPDQQQAVQATLRARQSADLIMSGKGMPESERQERGLTMIPQAGEDPATWAAKLENLRAFAQDAQKLAGPAAEARLNGATPAAAPKPKTIADHKARAAQLGSDVKAVQAKINSLGKNDPERARWEAVLKRIRLGGND
jgi:hypothetical protein